MAQIEKRKNGRWTMRVFIGRDPDTGKRKFVTRTYDRKKDADAEARRLERMRDLGSLTQPSKEPFGTYLKRWLEEVKAGAVRARTLEDYTALIRRYVKKPPEGAPPIGSIRMDRLTPAAFEALYTWMWKDQELAPRTIRYLHSVLRQALGYAVKTGKIPRNPTDNIQLKKLTKEEAEGTDKLQTTEQGKKPAMSEEEAGRFLEAARADRYHALWVVLLMGGLRPGEALGLGWDDVDLDGARIHVRRALTRRGVEGWALVPPKTARGRRTVLLPAVAVEALRSWRATQGRERLQLGDEYQDHGFVFTNEFGAPLHGSNLYARNFRRIMAAAELGAWEEVQVGDRVKAKKKRFKPAFRMYDLRHTCATLLLKKGENPKIVSERLGHSSITLTLDTYSHVLPDMQEGAADKMQTMFG